jgi:hypothetical protein
MTQQGAIRGTLRGIKNTLSRLESIYSGGGAARMGQTTGNQFGNMTANQLADYLEANPERCRSHSRSENEVGMAKTVQDHIARLRSIGDRPRATGSTGFMGATGNIGEQVSRLRAIAAERGQQINSIQDLITAWEEEDLDVMELLKNIPSSAYQFGSDVVEAVSDPGGMATNIGKVGVGIADLPFRAAGTEATGLQREGREALGQMASQMAGSLTPSALTERPVEGLANLAVGSGSALKGLSGLAKLGRMPGVAQTLQTASKAAMAADPTVMPFKAAGAATRAAGRGAARMATAAGERASTAGGRRAG